MGFEDFNARMLVLLNGHGGDCQHEAMGCIAKKLNENNDFHMKVVVDPIRLGTSLPFPIDHADIGETSISMELINNLVWVGRKLVPDLYSRKLPFESGTPIGYGTKFF